MKMRTFRYLVGEGIKNVWSNRLMSLASVGVLVACMFITGVAIVLSLNIDVALGDLEKQNVVMVYFADEANPADDGSFLTDEQAEKLAADIGNMDNIANSEFISRDEGLESLLADMTESSDSLFQYLDGENPLPNGARVQFDNLTRFDETVASLEELDGVNTVRHEREVAKKITGIRRAVNIASVGIVALLLVIAVVIVCNTIRITMYNRKLEISIMKAVGATNSFIRFPFMVEGAILGIIAAVFTTALLYAVYRIAVTEFETTMIGFKAILFRDMALQLLGGFALSGMIVGLLASRFTIAKYLRKEGSEFRAL